MWFLPSAAAQRISLRTAPGADMVNHCLAFSMCAQSKAICFRSAYHRAHNFRSWQPSLLRAPQGRSSFFMTRENTQQVFMQIALANFRTLQECLSLAPHVTASLSRWLSALRFRATAKDRMIRAGSLSQLTALNANGPASFSTMKQRKPANRGHSETLGQPSIQFPLFFTKARSSASSRS
jgi:hypothetical protein